MIYFKAMCAAVVLVLGAVWAAFRKGDKTARQETALEAAERYAKTRKVMDDAAIMGDDPDVLRDKLRARGANPNGNL